MNRRKIAVAVGIFSTAAFIIILFLFLLSKGLIVWNCPDAERYPMNGVDVSEYQGEIDWETMAQQEIQFAFIKATEGSSYTDPYFTENWNAAQETDLRIGAYHFFSYDSSGQTQYENFVSAVPLTEHMLPPAVDVEFYGTYQKEPAEPEQVCEELTVMLEQLEAYYGVKPILYATEKAYRLYIEPYFSEYDIWIRSVWKKPSVLKDGEWTFWQYSDRECLEGYQGTEPCIDRNVFCGDAEAFSAYGITSIASEK